jgi:methyl-accepting chemotaxis protein
MLGFSVQSMVINHNNKVALILQKAKDTNVHLVEKNFKGTALLSQILSAVQKMNGHFYEILSEHAAGTNKNGSERVLVLIKEAHQVVGMMEKYRDEYAAPEKKMVVQQLINDIKKYYIGSNHDGIFDVVSQMIDIDVSLVFSGMDNYRNTYQNIQKETAILVDEAKTDSTNLASEATQIMQNEYDLMKKESHDSMRDMLSYFILGAVLSIIFSILASRFVARSIRRIATDFEIESSAMINELSESSGKMEVISDKVNIASRKTLEDSQRMAGSASIALENVEKVAESTNTLSGSSTKIAQQMSSVASIASRAAEEAEHTYQKVKELDETARHIGDVVDAIKSIADQTNLLALNATIEAARAGDAGKGFAVVADEVKKLAVETTNKAEEIGERVLRIQQAVTTSVQAVDKIINEVKQIDSATSSVSEAVNGQGNAIKEIDISVASANERTTQVMNTVVTVIESARENEQTASVVLDASQSLSRVSKVLHQKTEGFIIQILNNTR